MQPSQISEHQNSNGGVAGLKAHLVLLFACTLECLKHFSFLASQDRLLGSSHGSAQAGPIDRVPSYRDRHAACKAQNGTCPSPPTHILHSLPPPADPPPMAHNYKTQPAPATLKHRYSISALRIALPAAHDRASSYDHHRSRVPL